MRIHSPEEIRGRLAYRYDVAFDPDEDIFIQIDMPTRQKNYSIALFFVLVWWVRHHQYQARLINIERVNPFRYTFFEEPEFLDSHVRYIKRVLKRDYRVPHIALRRLENEERVERLVQTTITPIPPYDWTKPHGVRAHAVTMVPIGKRVDAR